MSAADLLSKTIESDSEEDPDFVLGDQSEGTNLSALIHARPLLKAPLYVQTQSQKTLVQKQSV